MTDEKKDNKKNATVVSVLPEDVAKQYEQVENGLKVYVPDLGHFDLSQITLEQAQLLVDHPSNSHLRKKGETKKEEPKKEEPKK